VVESIEHLLNAPVSGAEAPTLARLEEALTDGYAHALTLEAERLRLERRISEVARQVDGVDFSAFAEELTSLGRRLTSADGEIETLRALLDALQQRTRETRRAVPAGRQ
jgi:ABC-type phosphate transport system auxiliary subunit